jgi:hypothetical protein
MTHTTTPDLPLPPGVVTARWQDLNFPGYEGRYFEGQRRVISQDRNANFRTPAVEVNMAGTHQPDGTIDEYYVVVHQLHADYPITAAQARQLARVLIAVAEEVDGLGDGLTIYQESGDQARVGSTFTVQRGRVSPQGVHPTDRDRRHRAFWTGRGPGRPL